MRTSLLILSTANDWTFYKAVTLSAQGLASSFLSRQQYRIGGLATGLVLLATVSAGCQQASDLVASSPANAAPTQPVEPAPPAAPAPPVEEPPTYSYNRGDQMFTLANDRPLAMYYFQASPTSTGDWENDILGESILMPGESTGININDGRQSCMYDFRAIFEDESVAEGYDVNICELGSYTFN